MKFIKMIVIVIKHCLLQNGINNGYLSISILPTESNGPCLTHIFLIILTFTVSPPSLAHESCINDQTMYVMLPLLLGPSTCAVIPRIVRIVLHRYSPPNN